MDNDLNSLLEIGESKTISAAGTGETYRYTKDPTRLTNIVKISYWIVFFLCIISLISNIMQMNLIESLPVTRAEADANDTRQLIIFLFALIAGLTNKVFFFIWVYRANLNCHGFNALGMRFTPGWTIGWFFIPFANLFKPYQAIKEIWHISDDPVDWQNNSHRKSSALPVLWWTLWIISAIISYISFVLSRDVQTISDIKTSTVFAIFSDIIFIPCILVFLSLVSNVFARQEALVGMPANGIREIDSVQAEYFCSECKEPVKEEDKFCHKCGANLEEITIPKNEN